MPRRIIPRVVLLLLGLFCIVYGLGISNEDLTGSRVSMLKHRSDGIMLLIDSGVVDPEQAAGALGIEPIDAFVTRMRIAEALLEDQYAHEKHLLTQTGAVIGTVGAVLGLSAIIGIAGAIRWNRHHHRSPQPPPPPAAA